MSIQFLGIPKVIEPDAFEGCVELKEIVVPKGSRGVFGFAYKFRQKYASRTPRIFIFECDDGRTARVFDEVKLMRINKDF